MHPISSQDESWFIGFYRTVRPTLGKHFKWSLPSAIGMWEVPCVFCLKWNGTRETLTQKKAGFPYSGLNLGSCFMSQDEGMNETPVETIDKVVGLRVIWTGGITSLWHLERHTEFNASKGDVPYSSWKWIGIPISLLQLESEPRSPASPPDASLLSC